MNDFYQSIDTPFFAPPSWVFGPAWTLLYILMGISFGWVVWKVLRKDFSPTLLWPFGINLISNLVWTSVFFRLQNFDLALIIILIVWGSIIAIMKTMWNHARWVSWIQIPYLLWVSFATILMIGIWWMN